MDRDPSASTEPWATETLGGGRPLVLVLDHEGRIVHFSPACEELTGMAASEVVGKLAWDALFPPGEAEKVRGESVAPLLACRHLVTSYDSNHWVAHDGSRRLIEWSHTALPSRDGHTEFIVCVGTDVAVRERVEADLHRSAQIIDQIHDSVITTDMNAIVTSYNRGSERIFGYSAEEVVGKSVSIFYPESGRRRLVEDIVPTLLASGAGDVEAELLRKDGRTFHAHLLLSLLRDGANRPVGMLGYILDVSARVRATEELASSERRLRDLNESLEARIAVRTRELEEAHRAARFGTWTWDFPTGDLEWSDQVFALFGYPPDYTEPSFEWYFEHILEEDRPKVSAHIDAALAGVPYDVEFRIVQPDGDCRWALARGEVVYDEAGDPRGMRGTCIDITARKVADEQLRASLRQKEVLLQEVHHRVKNNLAMVSAFLQLQMHASTDDAAIAALGECERRVRAMAKVHKLLYQSEDFESIFAQSLFEELSSALKSESDRPEVEVIIRPMDIHLSMEIAIPCAMIVNELLSNAIKHGYDAAESGTVEVSLEPVDEGYLRLAVCDHGRGLPDEFAQLSRRSLGLKLVDVFARQLGAKVLVNLKPACFEFVFRP